MRIGVLYELYPDCPATVLDDLRQAARELGFTLGSFDVIETARGAFFIDANSVSNISEDCTALFGMDLMRAHAETIARLAPTLARPRDGTSASNMKQERYQRKRERRLTMLSIEDVYGLFDAVGCCSFATLDGHGGVDARIAHFFAYDDEGLYLRTMTGKPFYRQMIEGGKLSACGELTAAPCTWDDENMPHFQPGYMVRVSGDVRVLSAEETARHAATDPRFAVAVYDTAKYPETVVLVLHRAWGELYDYDFNMVNRDHKILRERFAWGGAAFEEPGFRITDRCIACGQCAQACTHKAIMAGNPYRILGERCDECGNCHHACPVGAVVEKGAR